MLIVALLFSSLLPPVTDCELFNHITIDCAASAVEHNRAYLGHLRSCQLQNPSQQSWYSDAIAETELLYLVWDCVRDLKYNSNTIDYKRMCLAKLLLMLGSDYYQGRLPLWVPLHRFSEIR